MSDYYEEGKPFSLKNWGDLIRDLNEELTENAPSGCDGIEPLEEPEEPHIWSMKDVEDVREKIEQMCAENTFEEDLTKPWREEIIDEIEDQMHNWCDCTDSPLLLHTAYPVIGSCWGDVDAPSNFMDLDAMIDGMQVCSPGYSGGWGVQRRTYDEGSYTGHVLARGDINCSGAIEYTGGAQIPIEIQSNYWCWATPYQCRPGSFICYIMGEEWCDQKEQECIARKTAEDAAELAEAEETVADRNARGFRYEFWLGWVCDPPARNDCPQEEEAP
jgi:hypothetical protein